ncbi:DNA repair exonuclease [Candidatus Woesearchaeota archaeon]|jgi:DNA repair protein SbcD/Mre11|nr:DNA repair exonuclease [Candidatus Woesearchaeota archaeon]MBT4321624.1 DNA repair exonuclease [Candidatus Woesearchaeota archaeon]MBT4631065.1 DNA repair exonuclease [Candidatus Woesearchaeota archaeon]
MVKFAHIADCHIGGWSELKLKELGMQVFSKTIKICVEKQVDFVLIAGDLFNTALPSIDLIKQVALDLRKLKNNKIPVYLIAGSHDYSPSGKTMLDVFENAGLVKNVVKINEECEKIKLNYTIDEKTGVKITGLFGKSQGLEKSYYERLIRENLENEEGKKIFMFHTTLTEFKPEHLAMISSEPVAILPKGFDYYAGGHPHYVFNEVKEPYGRIAYPGALFPNNFPELEKFENGGLFINEFKDEGIISEYVDVKLKEVKKYEIDLTGKDSNQVKNFILDKIDLNEIIDKIVLLRLKGVLNSGRISEIDFKGVFSELDRAYVILKNSSELKIKEFEELDDISDDVDNIEDELIMKYSKEGEFVKNLINSLDKEKLDGEKVFDFELRVLKEVFGVLKLEDEN